MIRNELNSKNNLLLLINKTIAVLLISTAILLVVAGTAVLIYMNNYEGRIFPGVSVASIDLSGLTIDEAAVKLNNELNFPISGKITLRDGDRLWKASPIELGFIVNTPESIQKAYQVGRTGGLITIFSSQINSYLEGTNLSAIIMYDERVSFGFLHSIARMVDEPLREAELFLDGTSVIASNGRKGRLMNIDKTMKILSERLRTFSDGEVELVIENVDPSIMDAEDKAQILRKLLSTSILLKLPDQTSDDPGPWLIDVSTVARMIKIEKGEHNGVVDFYLGVYESQIISILEDIEKEVERSPHNARFIFNDDTRQLELIQNAIIGGKLNIDESLKKLQSELYSGINEFILVVDVSPPVVGDNAAATDLGITELVSTGVTYFWGSTSERIQNIQTASASFHGLLVAPGETFSMGSNLGDISLENGYAEALIIYGNRTITGVGGGVCQVSTTLFRTVFLGGYPVVERHPHAYRVGYYEQTYSGAKDSTLAGLDATVYVPLVDLKFVNDSQYWILMETYVNVYDHRLTWKFYSTNDGRSVQWNTTGPQNIKPAPKPLFQENPELGEHEMKQVDWAAEGADVIITRTVYKNNEVYLSDQFTTSYSPWQAICQYGIGVTDPEAKAEEKGICQ